MRLLIFTIFIALTTSGVVFWPTESASNAEPGSEDSAASVVATLPPLGAIAAELLGDQDSVRVLLAAGVSPHTYEPTPADVAAVTDAALIIYADKALDGWATQLPNPTRVALFEFVPHERRLEFTLADQAICNDPSHNHGHHHHHHHHHGRVDDPHFWTDPQIIRAMLPQLSELLIEHFPDRAVEIRANAKRFSTELTELDAELAKMLAPLERESVMLFHPSIRYFLRHYGLLYAGSVEPFPGQQPSARYLSDLVMRIRLSGTRAIFTEPQLDPRPARVLAENITDVPIRLGVLDPLGGVPGRMTYPELLRFNARALVETLGEAKPQAKLEPIE